jgi:hypothetical protein
MQILQILVASCHDMYKFHSNLTRSSPSVHFYCALCTFLVFIWVGNQCTSQEYLLTILVNESVFVLGDSIIKKIA